ncbi:hypothetical protein DBP19_36140 [Streptomyces sp. CS090A]|uniref:hypothetical protein n=1 Tax=Streptomyces sp. CS090A TaxID=2162710 RepID=UPI000D51FB06|nr:hypothetical protein [Streptomyces sp. CS090A]PVC80570.1 hypothetical protein DBP19_36140 [Streptomyces sp. CS090A]
MAATAFYRSTTTGVRIRIDDENATLNLSGDPARPNLVRVTELAISYKTTENLNGTATNSTSEVTDVVYVLDHEDTRVAYMNPDQLSQPDQWPAWVREQADQHSPHPCTQTASSGATTQGAAWHAVWLHCDWHWLTKNMSTAEREYVADAVQRYSNLLAAYNGVNSAEPHAELDGLRWWRD